jgi:hypothetical protein
MPTNAVNYLPALTTISAAGFALALFRHWRRRSQARHLMWWTIGVACFGLATFAEAITIATGWHAPVFRMWYIFGALLGGAPLAQGTVYLLMRKRTADRLAIGLVAYVAIAAGLVLAAPLTAPATESVELSGQALDWGWVRLLTPVVNLYATVFLVGGAAWSAIRYRRQSGSASLVAGNWLIAVGAILPAIGGSLARAGVTEVLYVTEFVGLLAIWAGYRVISTGRADRAETPNKSGVHHGGIPPSATPDR